MLKDYNRGKMADIVFTPEVRDFEKFRTQIIKRSKQVIH